MATSIKAIVAAATKYGYHNYGYGDNQVILVLEGKIGRVQWDLESMTQDTTPGLEAWMPITEEHLKGELGCEIAKICAIA